jgi:hypothetical protein
MLLLAALLSAPLPLEIGFANDGRLIEIAAGFPESALGKSAKINLLNTFQGLDKLKTKRLAMALQS